MGEANKPKTHVAWTPRREGNRATRWLEIGTASIESRTAPSHVYLDRTPIGGFTGYVYLAPVGELPPNPEPKRPGQDDDGEA